MILSGQSSCIVFFFRKFSTRIITCFSNFAVLKNYCFKNLFFLKFVYFAYGGFSVSVWKIGSPSLSEVYSQFGYIGNAGTRAGLVPWIRLFKHSQIFYVSIF